MPIFVPCEVYVMFMTVRKNKYLTAAPKRMCTDIEHLRWIVTKVPLVQLFLYTC